MYRGEDQAEESEAEETQESGCSERTTIFQS